MSSTSASPLLFSVLSLPAMPGAGFVAFLSHKAYLTDSLSIKVRQAHFTEHRITAQRSATVYNPRIHPGSSHRILGSVNLDKKLKTTLVIH